MIDSNEIAERLKRAEERIAKETGITMDVWKIISVFLLFAGTNVNMQEDLRKSMPENIQRAFEIIKEEVGIFNDSAEKQMSNRECGEIVCHCNVKKMQS